ncbi:hypothetical protein Patl1_34168 [Pistacia atlantica]|uniref:Uncharacterized protein n=1 Tax=Pistacia atlantica TaxID=434234 RepID=A0ACC0ZUU1_9ROSI|nr:hypothetical protein Patl1_34168 [Pistacia atlantica]
MWQSFDYPSDTLLPGMKLGINLQTGHKWFLQSWISDKSPAQGSFSLRFGSKFHEPACPLVAWGSLPDKLSIPELGFGMPRKVPTCRRDILTPAERSGAGGQFLQKLNGMISIHVRRSSTSNPAVFLVLWHMEKVQGEREVVAAISCCSRSSIIGPAVVLLMLFDTEKTEGKR